MANYHSSDPADAVFDEFETRRRIAAIEHELDRHWEEQPRRPQRSRRWWRRSDERWG